MSLEDYNLAHESTIYLILRPTARVDDGGPGADQAAAPVPAEPAPAPAAAAASLPIRIKLPSGQTYSVEGVTTADTIQQVKDRIFEQQGIEQAHQLLILPEEGKEAENDRSCTGIEVLQLVLVFQRGGARGAGGAAGEAVVPARFQPALNIYPGPYQDEWNEVYGPVKMKCDFEKCLELIAAQPTCVNNRSGGPTGWTLLHQAAYWMAPREILQALHQAGASPELEGQTLKQLQQDAGCVTPLLVTAEHDDDEEEEDEEDQHTPGTTKREAWRILYRDVFGLPQPGATLRGRGCVSLGMPPAQLAPQREIADAQFKHLVNEGDGRVLTLMPKDGKLQWGAEPQLVAAAEGAPGQKWRLEAGHLCCKDGGHMLDIDGANVKQGAKLVVWESRDRPNQTWEHTAEGYVVSALNGLCLHANEDGTVVTWPQQDEPCQKWRFA